MFISGTGKNLDSMIKSGLGGVIFFTHDIQSKEQFINLINTITKTYNNNIYPFLSIDQEGGRVERTENIHKRGLSPMFAFKKGDKFLKTQTQNIADELKTYGLNMNFAPCLDVNSNPNNPIIGERAFSNNPDEVCRGFDIVSKIYSNNGIIPVIKHFPGHGDADKDSHKELPKIDLDKNTMENIHLRPFKHAIAQGADAVMVAHLHSTYFDKEEIPTSLSKNCMNYLRNNLNFNGVIISDDMYMKGLSKYSMTDGCVMGINAGINLFIYREASDETLEVIENVVKLAENDTVLRKKIENSYDKILKLKSKYNLI